MTLILDRLLRPENISAGSKVRETSRRSWNEWKEEKYKTKLKEHKKANDNNKTKVRREDKLEKPEKKPGGITDNGL